MGNDDINLLILISKAYPGSADCVDYYYLPGSVDCVDYTTTYPVLLIVLITTT